MTYISLLPLITSVTSLRQINSLRNFSISLFRLTKLIHSFVRFFFHNANYDIFQYETADLKAMTVAMISSNKCQNYNNFAICYYSPFCCQEIQECCSLPFKMCQRKCGLIRQKRPKDEIANLSRHKLLQNALCILCSRQLLQRW